MQNNFGYTESEFKQYGNIRFWTGFLTGLATCMLALAGVFLLGLYG